MSKFYEEKKGNDAIIQMLPSQASIAMHWPDVTIPILAS